MTLQAVSPGDVTPVCVPCCPCRALAVDSLELEQEIDPLNVDHFSCTPLVRGHWGHRGHTAVAVGTRRKGWECSSTTGRDEGISGMASRDKRCLGDTLLTQGSVSPDVGVRPGAPGGGGAAVPLGPPGAGRPRHPGAAAAGPGTCSRPPGPGHPPRGAAGVTRVPALSPARPAHPLPAVCQPRHRYGPGPSCPPRPLSLCPVVTVSCPGLLVTTTLLWPRSLSPHCPVTATMSPSCPCLCPLQPFPSVTPMSPQQLRVPRCPLHVLRAALSCVPCASPCPPCSLSSPAFSVSPLHPPVLLPCPARSPFPLGLV